MPTEFGTDGNDTLTGGQNGDTLAGLDGDDLLDAGRGQDSLFGGDGNDTLLGGGGDDRLEGGDGDDSLDGGQGQDRLFGGDGNDIIDTGDTANNKSVDTVFGGDGDDTIASSGNQDVLNGEDDSDLFLVTSDGSNFNNLTVNGGEDSDNSDFDVLSLAALKADYPNLQIIYEQGQEGDENGRILIKTEPNGRELGRITYTGIEQIVICFTPGTMIATPRGEIPVEALKVGDRVMTRDNGVQQIAWIGRRDLDAADLLAHPEWQPVRIAADALAPGVPDVDLVVSPHHRVLLRGSRAGLYFNETEVLVAAKHLQHLPGVDLHPVQQVSYIHVMFAAHQIILANGAWAESFQPGDYVLDGMGDGQRAEIFALFPDLADGAVYAPARKILKPHEARLLL